MIAVNSRRQAVVESGLSDGKGNEGMRSRYFIAFFAGAWQVKLAALFVSPVPL